MAQLTVTETFYSVIQRDPESCVITYQENHKVTTTYDEEGKVVGEPVDEIVSTEGSKFVVAPRATKTSKAKVK
jgi:hypothetical protein